MFPGFILRLALSLAKNHGLCIMLLKSRHEKSEVSKIYRNISGSQYGSLTDLSHV